LCTPVDLQHSDAGLVPGLEMEAIDGNSGRLTTAPGFPDMICDPLFDVSKMSQAFPINSHHVQGRAKNPRA
jgi:hypothetical protein